TTISESAMQELSQILNQIPTDPGVYVLLGQNGLRYTGAARNLQARLRDHHAGRGKRTHNQRPLKLLHIETSGDFSAALKWEAYLKSGKGREWLNQQTVSP
ncbi:MAG TPA: GIY-YIG nuclease family protein, partial [Kiritimatiellia bacterium]|nr:GIY-YIG nuclease family protein [Kiritimatiellia bacterium]HQK44601.1 GIY-YIG nuclease family protein [Kiritimatiellia bacterium]